MKNLVQIAIANLGLHRGDLFQNGCNFFNYCCIEKLDYWFITAVLTIVAEVLNIIA
jgi:hypothetical protein